jgi:choline transporter-like protein 2/4/5
LQQDPTSVVAGGDDGGGANPFKPINRKCTDVLCLLFFLAFWVGMIVIAAIGYKNGEPKRLIYGTDWMGRTCGVKADASDGIAAYDLTDYPYLMYPRVAEDLVALEASGASLTDSSNLKKFFGVCVTECPMPSNSSSALYVHAYEDYTKYPEPVSTDSSNAGFTDEYVDAGSPWRVQMDTTEVLYRCMELSKIDVTESARCVDECSDEELAYYAAESITTYHCGDDMAANPFVDCGDKDCSELVLGLRPNCSTVQISRQETELAAARDDPVTSMLSRRWYMVSRWIGDIQKAAFPILICGGGFALVLGFIWLVMLRFCAGFFVWFVIAAVIVMQLIITLFCAYEGGVLTSDRVDQAMASMGVSGSSATTFTASISAATAAGTSYLNSSGYSVSKDTVHYWAIACYVMIALDLLLLVLLVFMCGRIRIAIGIIREASKALQTMPLLTLFPLLPTIMAVGLVAYWLVAAAYIATSAGVTIQDVVNTTSSIAGTSSSVTVEVSDDKIVNYLIIYHLFGLLWTNQLIHATAYTVIAGAFCEYYWTLDKRQIRALPVVRSVWRTLRYHLGTLAFGSLLIAIVQMARLALEYVDQKMRSAKQNNGVVKVAMMCFKCCLWCFEKCLKFLNKYVTLRGW